MLERVSKRPETIVEGQGPACREARALAFGDSIKWNGAVPSVTALSQSAPRHLTSFLRKGYLSVLVSMLLVPLTPSLCSVVLR